MIEMNVMTVNHGFDDKELAEIVDLDFSNNRLIFPTRQVNDYY